MWSPVTRLLVCIAFCSCIIMIAAGNDASAGDGIGDPKAWCAEVTKKLASGDADAVASMLEDGSRGAMQAADVRVEFSMVLSEIRKAKPVSATAFLTEKSYEGVLRSEWFMIVLDRAPYYVRCNLINYDGAWQFADLDLKPKPSDVGL